MSPGKMATDAWALVRETVKEWNDDDSLQWGAALAYYSVFALAPMLIVTLLVASLVFDPDLVEDRVFDGVEEVLGPGVRGLVEGVVERTSDIDDKGTLPFIVGLGAIVVGATGAFWHLSIALNRMWEIHSEPKTHGWWRLLRKRILSFGFVLSLGFLLLVSLLLSVLVGTVVHGLSGAIPILERGSWLIVRTITFAATVVLFTLLYKFLPDAIVHLRDAFVGGLVAGLLFEFGKLIFGSFLAHGAIGSQWGPAGALVLVLVWVWFVSQLLFLGAEFAHAHAVRSGDPIEPEEHAEKDA